MSFIYLLIYLLHVVSIFFNGLPCHSLTVPILKTVWKPLLQIYIYINHFLCRKCRRWMRYSCALGWVVLFACESDNPHWGAAGAKPAQSMCESAGVKYRNKSERRSFVLQCSHSSLYPPTDLKLLTLDHQPHWEDNCFFQGSTCSDLISSAFCCGYKPSDEIDVKLKSAQLKKQWDNR